MKRFKYAAGWLRFARSVGLSLSTLATSATVLAAEPRAASGTLVTQAVGRRHRTALAGRRRYAPGVCSVWSRCSRWCLAAPGSHGVSACSPRAARRRQDRRRCDADAEGTRGSDRGGRHLARIGRGARPGQHLACRASRSGGTDSSSTTGSSGGNILFSNRLRDSLAKRFGSPTERASGASSAAGAGSERETR